MSVYNYSQRHRRNFSLLTPQFNHSAITKMKQSTNRSLHKIQTSTNSQSHPNNLQANANNYSWLLIAAKQYYHKTNNLIAAITNFQEYLSHNPGHQESLYLCAVCYMNLQQYQKAVIKLKQFLAVSAKIKNTSNANNTNNNATTNTRKLIINANQALPNQSHAYLLLSMAYKKLNNLEKSLETINYALKNDSKFQQALCFRAKLYLKIGGTQTSKYKQKAFYDYKSVLKYNDRCWTAWVGLGDYYMEVNNYQQSLKSYEKAKQQIQNQKKSHPQAQEEQKQIQNEKQMNSRYNFSNYKTKASEQKQYQAPQKLDVPMKKSKFRTYSEFISQKQQLINEKSTGKQKLILNSITSPAHLKTGVNANFFQSNSQSKSNSKPPTRAINKKQSNLNVNFNLNLNVNLNVSLSPKSRHKNVIHSFKPQSQVDKEKHKYVPKLGTQNKQTITHQTQIQTMQQVQLKIAICLYFLGEHIKSISQLQTLLAAKVITYYTQIYYYLAVNQLKIHQQLKLKQAKNSSKFNKSNKKFMFPSAQIPMVSTTSAASNRIPTTAPQLLQQCILNLQSSIISNNNKKVMVKACKTLIKLCIQNNQFYQTQSIIKLAEKYKLENQLKQYKTLSEVTMMVIKQKYQQAVPILKRLYNQIIKRNNSNVNKKQEQNSKRDENLEKQKTKDSAKQKQRCSSLRISQNKQKLSINLNSNINTNKNNYNSRRDENNKQNIKINQFQNSQLYVEQVADDHDNLVRSNGVDRTYKMSAKQEREQQNDNDNFNDNYEGDDKNGNQFKNLTIKNKLETPKSQSVQPTLSYEFNRNNNDLQWMIPLILLFRAYSEFFSDNFIECLEIYEHYENYIKDYLGKQPEYDIYLSYNKLMCQAILMLDNQMIEQSLEKFMHCVENYYKLVKSVAVEPILFRVLGMIRLALSENPVLSQQVNTRSKVFEFILQVLDHYMPVIGNNCLVRYYYGLTCYQLEKYKQASDELEKCLKQAEQCTWKYLFAKGVIQIKNKLFKEAVRQFSAGLLVEQKPDLYLGRCICYIQLFDQSSGEHHTLMEKSFEDLQKFIQLEQNKDKISKWVTKILFFNRAYEQVTKSIKKVSNNLLESDQDLIKIQKSLNIYNGVFQQGGILGQVLINAFEGKFQETTVQISGERHQIMLSDFVQSSYKKWLNILNFYSSQRYSQLIKLLQLSIFEQKNQETLAQLRYNLAVVYYLLEQPTKADNVLAILSKNYPDLSARIQKFINRDFEQDQCVDDLQQQLKGVKRLSSFLPYRKISLNSKFLIPIQKQKSIYIKISIPFPSFYKPEIDLSLDDSFMYGQTAQTCIPKKIQAPWIKKITGNIQFTDNVISSHNTSMFEYDVLSPQDSKQELQSIQSSELKNF